MSWEIALLGRLCVVFMHPQTKRRPLIICLGGYTLEHCSQCSNGLRCLKWVYCFKEAVKRLTCIVLFATWGYQA